VRFSVDVPLGPAVAAAHSASVNSPRESRRYDVPLAMNSSWNRSAYVPDGADEALATAICTATGAPGTTVPRLSVRFEPDRPEAERLIAPAGTDWVALPG